MVWKEFRVKKESNSKMIRDRGWRRNKQELILKKRIKGFCSKTTYYYHGFHNNNEDLINHPIWIDHIGLKFVNFWKRDQTHGWSTKTKCKYSPNKNKGYYRDIRGKKSGCREKDKYSFQLILKENGLV